MELACWVLNWHFGPVLLPWVSKNDDEELCLKKYFGFTPCIFLWEIPSIRCSYMTYWNFVLEFQLELQRGWTNYKKCENDSGIWLNYVSRNWCFREFRWPVKESSGGISDEILYYRKPPSLYFKYRARAIKPFLIISRWFYWRISLFSA